jgi:AcrR family transcriptional regulator
VEVVVLMNVEFSHTAAYVNCVGRKKTRAETKQETRERLVTAAMTLFAEHGLDAPSLDDICDRAGYTRGAFYVHFTDRDDLITAVMDRVGRTFLDALSGANDDLATIAGRFVVALASGAYPLTRKGGIRPYQLLDACARSPAIRKKYVALVEETIERLSKATKQSQKKKAVRSDLSSDAMARMLVCVVIGVQTLMDLEVPIDATKNAEWILELLRAGA